MRPARELQPPLPLDVREVLLRAVRPRQVQAAVVAGQPGVVAGVALARREAVALGLSLAWMAAEGTEVEEGEEVARFSGAPLEVLAAEDVLVGLLGKPSGIATRTRAFVARAGRVQVVSGGWKKMPATLKEMIRGAVLAGGGLPRMVAGPFAYLDKNWVELLGGIGPSLAAAAALPGHARVVQVKGRYAEVAEEACQAAAGGADVVFVDTGRPEDAARAASRLAARGLRGRVRLAFGGGVRLEDMEALSAMDLDLVDVGRQIVDAPLLDLKLELRGERKDEGRAWPTTT